MTAAVSLASVRHTEVNRKEWQTPAELRWENLGPHGDFAALALPHFLVVLKHNSVLRFTVVHRPHTM